MFDNVAKAGKGMRYGKGKEKMSMLKDKIKSVAPAVKTPKAPTLPGKASDTARKSIMKGFLKKNGG